MNGAPLNVAILSFFPQGGLYFQKSALNVESVVWFSFALILKICANFLKFIEIVNAKFHLQGFYYGIRIDANCALMKILKHLIALNF